MNLSIKKVKFQNWDCVEVTDGKVAAIVTTEVGPRIVFYGFKDGFNHLATLDAFNNKKKGEGKGFTHYGGHRIWHAPEHPVRTYDPDDAKVEVEFNNEVVVFSQKQESTGLVKKLKLEFLEENKLGVAMKIVNNNAFAVDLSVWGITQFKIGGMLAVPNSTVDTGLVANRAISLWPYSKMTDSRVFWGDSFVTVVPTKTPEPFKFGSSCDSEYAAYFNNNELVIKHFPYVDDAKYPNYSCNFESYTNAEFIEIESLSPIDKIDEYGGELEMEEIWEIHADIKCPDQRDEKTITEILDQYVMHGCDCGDDCDCNDDGDGCGCDDNGCQGCCCK